MLFQKKQGTWKELELQRMITRCWPKLEESLQGSLRLEIPAPEEIKKELSNTTESEPKNYTRRIRGLTRETTGMGVEWLKECREKGGSSMMNLIDRD